MPATSLVLRLALCLILLFTGILASMERHDHSPFTTDSDCAACNVANTPAETPPVPLAILSTYPPDPGTLLPLGPVAIPPAVPVSVPPLRGPPTS